MKITTNNGMVFEGTQAEYEAFLAFAERKEAEQQAQESLTVVSEITKAEFTEGDQVKIVGLSKYDADEIGKIGVVEDEVNNDGYVYVRVECRGRLYKTENLELVSQANETIEFEGAEYCKVDREAREGDVVVLTGAGLPNWFTQGKAYAINESGRIAQSDSGSRNFSVYSEEYGRTAETIDVYEPIEQVKPYSPKVGDVVVITSLDKKASKGAILQVGDIGKVGEQGTICPEGSRILVPGGAERVNFVDLSEVRLATPAEIETYEKAMHKASFAVGDYVKLVKSYVGKEGAVLQITDDYDGIKIRIPSGEIVPADFRGTLLSDGETYGFTADQLVKATDAEIAKATAPKLKAGDFVKFKQDGTDITVGKAYELFEDYRGIYFVDNDGDKRWEPLKCSLYKHEIVSPEECKWAKLGRGVNEFKKGDVVRVIEDVCAKPVGTIFEVKRAKKFNVGCDEGFGYDVGKHIELVAPVESLVA